MKDLTVDILVKQLSNSLIEADIWINEKQIHPESLYSWKAKKGNFKAEKEGYWLTLEINPLLLVIREEKTFLTGIELNYIHSCTIDSDQCEITIWADKLTFKEKTNEN